MEATIKAVTKTIKTFGDNHSIGILIEGNNSWFNYADEKPKLEEMLKVLKRGAVIEMTTNQENQNKIDSLEIKSVPQETKGSEWQNEMINFEDLLNSGHEKGLKFVKTQMIAHDPDKKYAIFKAEVTMKGGNVFEATGDADQRNTGSMIAPHYIRMAETRALARALRFATNNAQTCDIETDSGMTEEGLI
jgi:hypothetical protein